MSATREARAKLSLAWLRHDEYTALLAAFGSVEDIVAQPAARLQHLGLSATKSRRIASPNAARLGATLAWLDAAGHRLVFAGDPDYPPLLTHLADPPLALYVNGDPAVLNLPALAVVGSRRPTRGGIANARHFAAHLGARGFSIVSGLALGIDAAAHEAALETGAASVAVMGTGIDRIYPAAHRDLARRLAHSGALVSEYPLGTAPRRQHFPERNRLITGLSLGTLVVEAARQSGSLISARLAAEQGREVFAIPGSIHNALARGCHQLIRQGARLVETGDDIVSELGSLVAHLASDPPARSPGASRSPSEVEVSPEPATGEREILLNAMGYDPVSADELRANPSIKSRLTIAELSSMLLILELEGRIEPLAGGRYARL